MNITLVHNDKLEIHTKTFIEKINKYLPLYVKNIELDS